MQTKNCFPTTNITGAVLIWPVLSVYAYLLNTYKFPSSISALGTSSTSTESVSRPSSSPRVSVKKLSSSWDGDSTITQLFGSNSFKRLYFWAELVFFIILSINLWYQEQENNGKDVSSFLSKLVRFYRTALTCFCDKCDVIS